MILIGVWGIVYFEEKNKEINIIKEKHENGTV